MARFHDLSLGLIKTDDSKKSWLCSCVAHTINRFANSVKINKEIPKRLKSFICFSFGLLLNSLDLESMLPIYQMICYVFLSSNINRYNISALEAIEELINTRPHEKETIQKICNELFERNDDDVDSESRVNENKDDENNEEDDIIDVNKDKYCYFDDESDKDDNDNNNDDNKTNDEIINDKIDDEKKKEKKKALKTLKCVSPFMKHFIEIKEDVISSIDNIIEGEDDEQGEENDFYCRAIISHLENRYCHTAFYGRHLL